MLNNLKNWIWPSKKKKNSFEEIVATSYGKNVNSTIGNKDNNITIVAGGEHGWDNYSYLKEIIPECDTPKDLSKYDGRRIIGGAPEKIKEELYKLHGNTVSLVDLEETKDGDDFICPTLKIALSKNDPVKLRDYLNNDACIDHGMYAVMLCNSDKAKTKGVRLLICGDEDGKEIRQYEVINGTYHMSLTWEVEGKACKMDIEISDDGSAKILKRNGVTDEQICAHQEVMIGGKEHGTKFLAEALGLMLPQERAKSSEIISLSKKKSQATKEKPSMGSPSTSGKTQCPYPIIDFPPRAVNSAQCPYPTTLITDFVGSNPQAESALREFASGLQAEPVKPLTNVTKADVKELGEKKEVSSPGR